jgi:hypothetical protein
MWYLAFCDWLISSSMSSFHVAAKWQNFISFYCWVIFHFVLYMPHFLYSFICQWTSKLIAYYFSFFAILGFELRVLLWGGRFSAIWATPPAPVPLVILEMDFHILPKPSCSTILLFYASYWQAHATMLNFFLERRSLINFFA